MRLLLAAGGTGGHVFPALALAAEANRRGHRTRLLGAEAGMEARLAAEAGVEFRGVPAGKWDRQRPDPRQALRAIRGLRAALAEVRSFAPDVVVGFGGFAALPGCVAAVFTRTPLLLHEGNATPGRVTRWFAGRAASVALAMPEAADRLAHARSTRVVGFPVREGRIEPLTARARLGIPEHGTLTLVMGGSQGSQALNERLPEVYRRLPEATRGHVLHATGPRWLETVQMATSDLADYLTVGFVDATLAWSAADLAVVRSGVGTLSEAALHHVPVVTVPLPTSADDHQRSNAHAIAAAGAGFAVEQEDVPGLQQAWSTLLDPDRRATASEAMALRTPEGAAGRLLAEALRVAGEAGNEDES